MSFTTDLLVVETGVIVAGATSYASLEQANTFHAMQLYTDAWTTATDPDKAKGLMMATRLIDANTNFEGRKRSAGQPLAWPRLMVPNDDALNGGGYPATFFSGWAGYGVNWGGWTYPYLPADKVPPQIIAATCQMAFELLIRNRTAEDPTKGIRSIGLGQGAISVQFDSSDRRDVMPDTVRAFLRQVGEVRSTSSFQKRVVRVQ